MKLLRLIALGLVMVSGGAVAASAETGDRMDLAALPPAHMTAACALDIKGVVADTASAASLRDVVSHRLPDLGGATLAEYLAASDRPLDIAHTGVLRVGAGSVFLIPAASSDPTQAAVVLVSADPGDPQTALLEMIEDPLTRVQVLRLGTLDGSFRYVWDLGSGKIHQEGDASKTVTGTLLCLWNSLVTNVVNPGDLACTWSSVIATCITNFSQCIGGVQGALQQLACSTGINIAWGFLQCFDAAISDTQAPAINSLTPGLNATISSPVNISCAASDNHGVTLITLLFDSEVVGTCSNSNSCTKSFTLAGSYSSSRHGVACTARDAAGNSKSKVNGVTVAATANQSPTPSFSFTTSGLTASFTDRSTDSDGTIASRYWSFGDGTFAVSANPTKTYLSAGTRTVSLTVTDNGGKSATIQKSVTVANPATCSGTLYSGTLASGATAVQPNGTYYQSTAAGTHAGRLTGPSGTDFDLWLYRWSGSSWGVVASATGLSNVETVSYAGSAGYYYWRVKAYSGSGSYTLCINRP